MFDGTCTGWPDGNWIDCCYQHDCDCDAVYPLPCPLWSNAALMQCVIASSYSVKCKYPELVRVNAVLMLVGVTVFNPLLRRLGQIHGKHLQIENII